MPSSWLQAWRGICIDPPFQEGTQIRAWIQVLPSIKDPQASGRLPKARTVARRSRGPRSQAEEVSLVPFLPLSRTSISALTTILTILRKQPCHVESAAQPADHSAPQQWQSKSNWDSQWSSTSDGGTARQPPPSPPLITTVHVYLQVLPACHLHVAPAGTAPPNRELLPPQVLRLTTLTGTEALPSRLFLGIGPRRRCQLPSMLLRNRRKQTRLEERFPWRCYTCLSHNERGDGSRTS